MAGIDDALLNHEKIYESFDIENQEIANKRMRNKTYDFQPDLLMEQILIPPRRETVEQPKKVDKKVIEDRMYASEYKYEQ